MRFEPGGDLTFQLEKILNEGIEFNDNLRGGLLEADLVVGENTVQHGLGFVPIGYIVLYPGIRTVSEDTSKFQVVKRDVDDFLLFLEADESKEVGGDFTGVRIDEWTTEQLFLNASVASQGVRLFVL